jgi:uncharacterized protein YecE (DUF72 family)
MSEWRIGCSGFHYPEWKALFYPEKLPKNKWFEFYAQHFNTIELNTTFYRFPRVDFLRNWAARCPDNFTFSVKAPRVITHFKKFKDSQRMLGDFYRSTREGLGNKLGCVLFQFPTVFAFEDNHLERIVSLLDKSFTNVVEFRHPSWWNEKVYQILSENNIVFCGMSHPGLSEEVIRTSQILYYRLHGVPHLYYSSYGVVQLEQIVSKLGNLNSKEVYVYFNNTAEGAAVLNAGLMRELCEHISA